MYHPIRLQRRHLRGRRRSLILQTLAELPRRPPLRKGLKYVIATLALRLGRFRPVGDPPQVDQSVLIAAPHTALVDAFWMMAFAWYWGVPLRWLVKISATKGPLGWFLRSVGAVPVDRSAAHGLVSELAQEFATQKTLHIAVPAEGTRARRTHWKSGFYHLARSANVPICLSYLDYGKREGGFGPAFLLSGNISKDMDRIRAFYAPMIGKFPNRFTPPRLKEEDSVRAISNDSTVPKVD